MFDAPQFYINNNFNQVVEHSFYRPQQFFPSIIQAPNEFFNSLSYSSSVSNNVTLPQTNMSVEENGSITGSTPNVSLNSPSTLNFNASGGKNKDDEISDSDMSCEDEDESLTNPYFEIINSQIPKQKPSNWRSLVLFNGRINPGDLPKNCPRPQCNDGSILPQIRPIVKSLLNPDGTLRTGNKISLSMKLPAQNSTKETPKSNENRGYVSANGLVWSKRRLEPETPVTTKPTTPFPAQTPARKRFSNQSLIIAGGKRIRTDNSNECIAFAQSGKCTAGKLCTFEHGGKSDHCKEQLCRSQMLGTCRKDINCNEGLHGLAKHQIPVCQYYLNMTCVNESCPYLHIKHNDKLEYCNAFQRGTCLLGLKVSF